MLGLLLGRHAAVYEGLHEEVWLMGGLISDLEYAIEAGSS